MKKLICKIGGCFKRGRGGQAMTEVVLLFPIFMLIAFMMAKIFALLVLVQKMEIGSYYAARRWQLESHLNVDYLGDDDQLRMDIEEKVRGYVGFNNAAIRRFLNLRALSMSIRRTQVWNVVTLTVETDPVGMALMCRLPKQAVCTPPYGQACNDGYDYICSGGRTLEVIKYVPNRDRPIKFVLPGIR